MSGQDNERLRVAQSNISVFPNILIYSVHQVERDKKRQGQAWRRAFLFYEPGLDTNGHVGVV